jgi:hypothetical protein
MKQAPAPSLAVENKRAIKVHTSPSAEFFRRVSAHVTTCSAVSKASWRSVSLISIQDPGYLNSTA